MMGEKMFLIKFTDGQTEEIQAETFIPGELWTRFVTYQSSFLDIRDGTFVNVAAIKTDLIQGIIEKPQEEK